MKLDIVLLQCGFPDLTIRCLKSIHDTFDDCRVILVDNGSSTEDIEAAALRLEERPSKLICNGENLGFAKAINIGLAASDAPYACILNNDTVIYPEAFERMLHWLDRDLLLGLIGPLTNSANTHQRVSGPEACSPGYLYTPILVAFFCAILPRTVYETVGPLSEEYGLGYGEDDDYCIRVRQAGYRTGIARDAYVHHDHHTTYRHLFGDDGIKKMGEEGLALVREKYGAIT